MIDMGNDTINIGFGGGSLICIILILAIFHYSCGEGSTATGMLADVCKNGLGFWDWVGTIFCSPIYLFLLLIYSTGVKLW